MPCSNPPPSDLPKGNASSTEKRKTDSTGTMKRPFDRDAMARAVADFICAAGFEKSDPNLQDTPRLVADAWANELLAGYETDPAHLLSKTAPAPHRQPVFLTGISFVGVCPHHLLPYEGVAHIGYLPDERIVGFGTLVRLVTMLGARLILQEDLAEAVARTLLAHLSARGAGCIIEAKQGCVAFRGVRQPQVRTITKAWAGSLEDPSCPERISFEASLGAQVSSPDSPSD